MLTSRFIDDFQAQVSRSLYIDRDDDGQHYIATPFAFDDGDEPVVALIEDSNSQLLLSDLGNTFCRMSYESRPDPGDVSRALADAGISRHNGELTKCLPQGQYAEAVLDFVHALLKIDRLDTHHIQDTPVSEAEAGNQRATAPAPWAEDVSLSEIARGLQSQISQSLYIETDARGQHYIATPFVFGDGDQPVIALSPEGDGWALSDRGNSLFRLGHQLTDAEYDDPALRRRMDSALVMAGIKQRDDELVKEIPPGQYAAALFDFVHALLKIDELGDYPALANPPVVAPKRTGSEARAQIKDEVRELVAECVPQDRFVPDWYDPGWDRDGEYPVDFKVNGMPRPLFLHTPGNLTLTQEATIAIYRFREQGVDGKHIAIFRGNNRISAKAKSKLRAVCDATFDDLEGQRPEIKEFLRQAAGVSI